MNIYIKDIKEGDCYCDSLILPFTEGVSGLYDRLSPSIPELIKRVFSKEFNGKQNEVLLVPAPEDIKPERIFFIGLGKKDEVSREKIRQAGGKAAVYLRDSGMKKSLYQQVSCLLTHHLLISSRDFCLVFILLKNT